jgi:hypothetical protein
MDRARVLKYSSVIYTQRTQLQFAECPDYYSRFVKKSRYEDP